MRRHGLLRPVCAVRMWRVVEAGTGLVCSCLPWDVVQGKQVAASAHTSQASRSGMLGLVALAVLGGKQAGGG